MKTRYAYRLVYSPIRHPSATQTTFLHWIKAEAIKTKDLVAEFLSDA